MERLVKLIFGLLDKMELHHFVLLILAGFLGPLLVIPFVIQADQKQEAVEKQQEHDKAVHFLDLYGTEAQGDIGNDEMDQALLTLCQPPLKVSRSQPLGHYIESVEVPYSADCERALKVTRAVCDPKRKGQVLYIKLSWPCELPGGFFYPRN